MVAKLNGKSYRKMLKTIEEHGKDNVVVVLQGVMRDQGGGQFYLEGAGFQVNVKSPPPAQARQASANAAASPAAPGATGFLWYVRCLTDRRQIDEAGGGS